MTRLLRTTAPTPVGTLTLVASDTGLRAVLWPDDRPGRVPLGNVTPGSHPLLDVARRQLDDYFAHRRTGFAVPLDLQGTELQATVWAALADIAYGATVTYGELARRCGRPRAARAVAAAVARNPVSVVLPCHRVIRADGAVGGFAGGVDTKRALLRHEAAATGGTRDGSGWLPRHAEPAGGS